MTLNEPSQDPPVSPPPRPPDDRPLITIDLGAIAANWAALDRLDDSETGAVVKADAYGLGVEPVASALAAAGCGTFFVANIDEGIHLRHVLNDDALASARIFVLHGARPDAYAELDAFRLSPVLNTFQEAEIWAMARRATSPPCALHVDTGMNRLGVTVQEAMAIAHKGALAAKIGLGTVMSHFASADEPGHPYTALQMKAFAQVLAAFEEAAYPVEASLANSAGCFLGPDARLDLTRPGIALYGADPRAPHGRSPITIRPVVTLTAPILQVREVQNGAYVGYGGDYCADGPRRLATVALGYGDGFLRAGGPLGYGVVHGVRAPIAGRVSMDLITLDITDVGTPPDVGDHVEFLSAHADLDDQAWRMGSFSYEVLTRLSSRAARLYVRDGRPVL